MPRCILMLIIIACCFIPKQAYAKAKCWYYKNIQHHSLPIDVRKKAAFFVRKGDVVQVCDLVFGGRLHSLVSPIKRYKRICSYSYKSIDSDLENYAPQIKETDSRVVYRFTGDAPCPDYGYQNYIITFGVSQEQYVQINKHLKVILGSTINFWVTFAGKSTLMTAAGLYNALLCPLNCSGTFRITSMKEDPENSGSIYVLLSTDYGRWQVVVKSVEERIQVVDLYMAL